MIRNFNELIERLQREALEKKVAVVCAHDEHTLDAIDVASKDGIITPVLIGKRERIEQIIEAHGFALKDAVIHEESDDILAAKKAVLMIREGEADFIMKGKLQTSDLLREVVNKETGLYKGRVMSHVGFFEIPGYHKLLALTDGGMLPAPNLNEKVQIILNALDVLFMLGYEKPKIAALAAAEIVNPKIQASVDGGLLKKMNEDGEISGCIIEGPISYDLMISAESAKTKGYDSPVSGDADALLMPDMTSGNLLAKSFQYTAGAKMAGMIVGAEVPIVLVSRSATAEEKYLSLMLCAASARKRI